MRFGMGLMNIQGQVQSVAIGLLLILSILLPNLGKIFSIGKWTPRQALLAAVAVLLAVLFGYYFFWSRALVLNAA
jgi:hypothetical protein